jgi:hypothetical protein
MKYVSLYSSKTEVVTHGPGTRLHIILRNAIYIAMKKLEVDAVVCANDGYRKLGTHYLY